MGRVLRQDELGSLFAVHLGNEVGLLGEERNGVGCRSFECTASHKAEMIEQRAIHHRAEEPAAHLVDYSVEAHGWQDFDANPV